MFYKLLDLIKDNLTSRGHFGIQESRQHKLTPEFRLFLVLFWLRKYPNITDCAAKFNISYSTVSREIHTIIPILVEKLNHVKIPSRENIQIDTFENHMGLIDGAVHPRNRQHPNSYDDFRYDKQCFFIGSQVVTSPKGALLNFTFSKGHNNDQGVYNRSWIKSFLHMNGFNMLADGGYHDIHLVCPQKKNGKEWNDKQKQKRSLVEIVIGYIKNWGVAGGKFRHGRELHEASLWVVYQLAAWKLKKYPIRQ